MSISLRKKLQFGVFLWIILYVPVFGQGNYVNFNTIPKDGTVLIYGHQDDDLIWMLPFWKITEKFIGAAMPPTPRSRTLVHQQQDYMDSKGYGIDYRNNWITPWTDITDEEYKEYYWLKNPEYDTIALDHLEAHMDISAPMSGAEINKLKAKIEQYIASPTVSRIMTHNIWGEYGHYHHKGVDIAARELAVKYRKDVWMLGCDNGSFINVAIPAGITYTTASYDTALFSRIRNIYKANYYWTWDDSTPGGNYNYIKIVEAGNDRSGVFTGETVTTPGPQQDVPGAYIFDGIDDYLTLAGNNNAFFTISMRVRPEVIKAMDISKMSEYPSATTCDRSFYLESSGQLTARIFDGQSTTVTSVTALTAGTWTNIVMTGDGSNLKIYINGIPEGSVAAGIHANYASPEFVLGQAQETSSFFKGQISDVAFYDRALTASEIAALTHSLTISGLTANSKEYDGTKQAILNTDNLTLEGVSPGDIVNLVSSSAKGTFANKNAGSGKIVTTSGFTLSGANASEYSLVQPSLTADIEAAPISISGVTAGDKVYDGTTDAVLYTGSSVLAGVRPGDAVSLVLGGASGTFDDKNVGTGKPVTTTGFELAGADALNYALTQPIITADITAVDVTVSGVTAFNKIYDATTTALLNTQSAILTGILPGDDVNLSSGGASGTFVNKKAGNGKAVSTAGFALIGADKANYALTQPATTADISKAELAVSGATALNKAYDGTTGAVLNTTGAALNGVLTGDHVSLVSSGATGTFLSKNAGSGKPVTTSGFIINGTDAANYTLLQPSLSAGITPVGVTISGVTASDKPYDGTTKAILNTGNASPAGFVPGDDVSLVSAGAAGTFVNKNAGTGKTVSTSGFALSGADAGNYTLTLPSLLARITTINVTVSGVTASDKIYDGSAIANLNTGSASLHGLVPGDAVSLVSTAATGTFVDRNAGVGKRVSTSGFVISGPDAPNYVLIQPETTASITTAALTISGVVATDKVYNGTSEATLNTGNATLSGVKPGDAVVLISTGANGTFDNKNAGTGKTVTTTGFITGGTDAGNYHIIQPSLIAGISAKQLIIAANDLTKNYGASLTFTGSEVTMTGLVPGDAVAGITLNSPGAVSSAGTGTYIISVTAGNNDNYEIQSVNARLDVLKATLTVTADDKTKEYKQINPVLTVSYAGFVPGQDPGVLDMLPVIETAAGTDSDAGIYDLDISGAVSANYNFIYKKGKLIINKANQVITFEKIPDGLRVKQGYQLKATASSGLPVSFEVSDAISGNINGDILTLKSIGDLIVTAVQEGSSNWNPAPHVPQSIIVGPEFDIIPSLFTPNNDGMNDYWKIPGLEQYGKLQVTIYNRYGQTVYQSDNYKNNWYGTYNGINLPSSTYYYIIKSSTKGIFKGVVNIVR